MLTRQDLTNLSNLLYTGKWNMSLQESTQTVSPLINKIAQEIDALDKPKKLSVKK